MCRLFFRKSLNGILEKFVSKLKSILVEWILGIRENVNYPKFFNHCIDDIIKTYFRDTLSFKKA